ncbi:MAG: DNA mismatch repair protein MutL [Phycisphaerales bacterium]|nr:DNA mismatch repair protein MutL [Phycisphaerales bacterium]
MAPMSVAEPPSTPGLSGQGSSGVHPRIRPMSTLLASQIAAGEVIERPASVVKELVENSLDAGATRITVEIEQGGIELIRVTDDGGGMVAEDLPLALAPHATSKITAADDLDRVATLGFRGEALASVVSVARVSIRSRTPEDPGAWHIEGEGSRIGDVRPAAGPVGTCVTVRTLFFNTPARRKFLRTIQTEQTRCVEAIRELAIGRPSVAFTMICDGRTLFELPPGQTPRQRALSILGRELEPELIEVHADDHDAPLGEGRTNRIPVAIWGLAGRPALARATNKSQHVLLNGRAIRDRTIQHAVMEAYRGLIEPGRYPTAVLLIEMPPTAVDVNVHPAKAEVRFRDSSLVHSVVLGAIRRALRAADLTPGGFNTGFGSVPRSLGPDMDRAILPAASAGQSTVAMPARPASPAAFVEFFQRFTPARGQAEPLSYDAIRAAVAQPVETPSQADSTQTGERNGDPAASAPAPVPPAIEPGAAHDRALPTPVPPQRLLQVHSSYIVTQDEHGMLIIDQHALHERAMFEYLLARIAERQLESQNLLAPVPVAVTTEQMEMLPSLEPLLDRIGIRVDPLGPLVIGVRTFPTFLFDRNVDPVEFMQGLFERAEAEGFVPGSEQALRDVLDMMSCKAAVKAGDRMSPEELDHLVRLRSEVERSSNCPHGRPTSIRITMKDLERMFGRS